MKDVAVADVRNFVLMGHTGGGKTTLCEALLVKVGAAEKMGSVPAGTTLSDYTDEEIHRKTSIYAQSFPGVYKAAGGKKVEVVVTDTPGVEDFFGQVLCASRVADSALVVIDAVSGIHVGTTNAWRRCDDLQLPRGVVVTGLDRDHADFSKVLADIQAEWGAKCVPVVFPAGGKLISALTTETLDGEGAADLELYKSTLMERAAETDDTLIEEFLGGTPLTPEELISGMRAAVRGGTLIPIFAVMPLKDQGVTDLLEGISRLFPNPSDIVVKDAAGQPINTSPDAPLVAFVWRTVIDPYAGKLAFVRVYGGTLKESSEVYNATQSHKESIGGLLTPHGKKPVPTTEAKAGDIVALAKLKTVAFNDVLCAVGTKVQLAPIAFPAPVVSMAVSAKDRNDEDKIGIAISRVADDDPTLRVERHAETHELIISGMGDTQMDVAHELMKKRSNVDVELKVPKVSYRETVTGHGEGHYKHKKQSGGRGQYAEVYCKLASKKPDEEWFEDAVVGGVIPRNFIPACEKGFLEAMAHGPQAGFPVVDVKVSVYDGSYHDVDSSEIAFKIAAVRAFKDAMSKSKPVLLEPIMTVRVTVPGQYMGDITSDLNHKRGRIHGVELDGGMEVITAEVPQSEMFRYCSELRSITGGRGSFELKFARYDVAPANIAQKIIASAEKAKVDEE